MGSPDNCSITCQTLVTAQTIGEKRWSGVGRLKLFMDFTRQGGDKKNIFKPETRKGLNNVGRHWLCVSGGKFGMGKNVKEKPKGGAGKACGSK